LEVESDEGPLTLEINLNGNSILVGSIVAARTTPAPAAPADAVLVTVRLPTWMMEELRKHEDGEKAIINALVGTSISLYGRKALSEVFPGPIEHHQESKCSFEYSAAHGQPPEIVVFAGASKTCMEQLQKVVKQLRDISSHLHTSVQQGNVHQGNVHQGNTTSTTQRHEEFQVTMYLPANLPANHPKPEEVPEGVVIKERSDYHNPWGYFRRKEAIHITGARRNDIIGQIPSKNECLARYKAEKKEKWMEHAQVTGQIVFRYFTLEMFLDPTQGSDSLPPGPTRQRLEQRLATEEGRCAICFDDVPAPPPAPPGAPAPLVAPPGAPPAPPASPPTSLLQLPCNHGICTDCWPEFCKHCDVCPLCKYSLNSDKLDGLFFLTRSPKGAFQCAKCAEDTSGQNGQPGQQSQQSQGGQEGPRQGQDGGQGQCSECRQLNNFMHCALEMGVPGLLILKALHGANQEHGANQHGYDDGLALTTECCLMEFESIVRKNYRREFRPEESQLSKISHAIDALMTYADDVVHGRQQSRPAANKDWWIQLLVNDHYPLRVLGKAIEERIESHQFQELSKFVEGLEEHIRTERLEEEEASNSTRPSKRTKRTSTS
jgi:hypothetical protein